MEHSRLLAWAYLATHMFCLAALRFLENLNVFRWGLYTPACLRPHHSVSHCSLPAIPFPAPKAFEFAAPAGGSGSSTQTVSSLRGNIQEVPLY